ncbi:MAG: thioredoxin family protein [Rikenellaceae bacterium]|nr:thioredoxin family protein [Rikenellaceae bacterium]
MLNFERMIWQERLTFVAFTASWCNRCRQMEPILQRFEERMAARSEFLTLDIEEPTSEPVVRRYHVVSVPTLMFFRRGELLWRESGAVSFHHLTTILEELEEYELAGHF